MSGTLLHYMVDGVHEAVLDWDKREVDCPSVKLDFATSRALVFMRKHRVKHLSMRGHTLEYLKTSRKPEIKNEPIAAENQDV